MNEPYGQSPADKARRRNGRIGGLMLVAMRGGAATAAPAQAGSRAQYLHTVEPECVLPEAERQTRANALMRATMCRLAARSVAARARRKNRSN